MISCMMRIWAVFLFLMSLSIVTYNSQGHAPDRLKVIDDLVQCHDFVLIQEHWYLSTQLSDNIIQTHFDNVCSHSVSGVPDDHILEGRPFGGTAILWKQSLNA